MSAYLFVDSKIQSSVVCWYITYKRPYESRKGRDSSLEILPGRYMLGNEPYGLFT